LTPGILVLVSGGLDSAVLLAWARQKGPVASLGVEGPDRPAKEREAAERLLDHYRVRDRFTVALPAGVTSWLRGDPTRAYVPGRNLFFHGAALLLAHRLGCRWVAAGHSGDDAQAFRDARRPFFDALETLDRKGLNPQDERVGILTPFLGWSKRDVAARGRDWGVPLELSWSCYRDGPTPCGVCTACRERRDALSSSATRPPRRGPSLQPAASPKARADGAGAKSGAPRPGTRAARGSPRSSGSRRSSSSRR